MRKRNIGVICLITSGVLYGFQPLFCYIADLLGSNTDTFLSVRALLSVPIFFIILKTIKVPIKMPAKGFRDGVIGAVLHAVCALLLTLSYQYIGGGMATTLHFVYPMCVMLMSCIIFKAKVTLIRVLSLALGTIGVALVSSSGGEISILGVVLAVASGVVYAAYIVYVEHSAIQTLHPFQMAIITQFTIFIVVLSYSITVDTFNISHYTLATIAFCFVAILAVSIGAGPLFQVGVHHTDATTSSLLSTTEPITAVVIGAMFLKENFTIMKFLGCICILSGVFLVILGDHREAKATQINATS